MRRRRAVPAGSAGAPVARRVHRAGGRACGRRAGAGAGRGHRPTRRPATPAPGRREAAPRGRRPPAVHRPVASRGAPTTPSPHRAVPAPRRSPRPPGRRQRARRAEAPRARSPPPAARTRRRSPGGTPPPDRRRSARPVPTPPPTPRAGLSAPTPPPARVPRAGRSRRPVRRRRVEPPDGVGTDRGPGLACGPQRAPRRRPRYRRPVLPLHREEHLDPPVRPVAAETGQLVARQRHPDHPRGDPRAAPHLQQPRGRRAHPPHDAAARALVPSVRASEPPPQWARACTPRRANHPTRYGTAEFVGVSSSVFRAHRRMDSRGASADLSGRAAPGRGGGRGA